MVIVSAVFTALFEQRCYIGAFPLARQLANSEGLYIGYVHIDGERADAHSLKMRGDKPLGPEDL